MSKDKKKDLLNTDEPVLTIESIFQFEELKLKKDTGWRLKMRLKTQLPEIFREYKLLFTYNDTPDLEEIEQLERRKDYLKDENSLFPQEKKKELKDCDAQIVEIRNRISENGETYPDFEAQVAIEAIKYEDTDTIAVFVVPSELVDPINTHRHDWANYKVKLIRE